MKMKSSPLSLTCSLIKSWSSIRLTRKNESAFSALKLMAYLMLGRAEDVDKMTRRFDLVGILNRQLRDGVERTQVLSLTVLRVAVCRPALHHDGHSSFPSVAQLRSLLQGSKALGLAASKLVSDGVK